jgi:hypothetical protein
MKENDMGRECGTYSTEDKGTQSFVETPQGKGTLEKLKLD